MKLRKRLVVGIFALLMVGFLGSEWNQKRHASAVVASCLEVAQSETQLPHAEELCAAQQALLASAARDRLLGGLVLTLAITGLIALWLQRAVAKPLQSIIHQVRIMGLGSWGVGTRHGNASPQRRGIENCDEVFELQVAMRDLDERLHLSVCQIEAVSRRAIMALLSRRTERRLELIREYLASAKQIVESARAHQQLPPRHLLENLAFVEREIADLERSLESDWLAELNHRPAAQCSQPQRDALSAHVTGVLPAPQKQPAVIHAV
jgi:hypothetical protein